MKLIRVHPSQKSSLAVSRAEMHSARRGTNVELTNQPNFGAGLYNERSNG